MSEISRRSVIAGITDAIAGFPTGNALTDRHDLPCGAIAGSERKLRIGQVGVLEPLVGAGVDGKLGAGADGADVRVDEHLVRGGIGKA